MLEPLVVLDLRPALWGNDPTGHWLLRNVVTDGLFPNRSTNTTKPNRSIAYLSSSRLGLASENFAGFCMPARARPLKATLRPSVIIWSSSIPAAICIVSVQIPYR